MEKKLQVVLLYPSFPCYEEIPMEVTSKEEGFRLMRKKAEIGRCFGCYFRVVVTGEDEDGEPFSGALVGDKRYILGEKLSYADVEREAQKFNDGRYDIALQNMRQRSWPYAIRTHTGHIFLYQEGKTILI